MIKAVENEQYHETKQENYQRKMFKNMGPDGSI